MIIQNLNLSLGSQVIFKGISSSNGRLSLQLNGTRFELGTKSAPQDSVAYYVKHKDGTMHQMSKEELYRAAAESHNSHVTPAKSQKVYLGFGGVGSPTSTTSLCWRWA